MKNISTHPRGGVKEFCRMHNATGLALTDPHFLPTVQLCSHQQVGMIYFSNASICRCIPS